MMDSDWNNVCSDLLTAGAQALKIIFQRNIPKKASQITIPFSNTKSQNRTSKLLVVVYKNS